MEDTSRYTLQLRFIGNNAELEVLAQPAGMGKTIRGRFQHWEPVLDDICLLMQSSAFHRKAIQRTLTAGLAADLINRETGDKHFFSADEVAGLSLTPMISDLNSDLSTAA